MNKIVIALGAVLLIVSVIAITYTTTGLNLPKTPCGFGCLNGTVTVNPYASDGILLAMVALATMGIGSGGSDSRITRSMSRFS